VRASQIAMAGSAEAMARIGAGEQMRLGNQRRRRVRITLVSSTRHPPFSRRSLSGVTVRESPMAASLALMPVKKAKPMARFRTPRQQPIFTDLQPLPRFYRHRTRARLNLPSPLATGTRQPSPRTHRVVNSFVYRHSFVQSQPIHLLLNSFIWLCVA
jgi:hypothetical protein